MNNKIRLVALMIAVLVVISMVFVSCDGKKTENEQDTENTQTTTENDENKNEVPEDVTTPEEPDDEPEQPDDEPESDSEKTDDEIVNDVLDVTKLPELTGEESFSYSNGVTYLMPDGQIAGGGSVQGNIGITMKLPEGVTCFTYRGDGNSPDWGLALYKVATEDDFADEGYYVIENTVDGRFVGFGNDISVNIFSLPNGYNVMEERIEYFGGGVGYNYYVRVDGEYIVKMSIAEANDDDVNIYRAVVASFDFKIGG